MSEPYDWIFLADDEWGSDTMREIAEAHFAEHPELDFVEVHEHAGWFLGYHRSGAIVSTANDSAVLSKDAQEIRDRHRQVQLRHVIRRQHERRVLTLA